MVIFLICIGGIIGSFLNMLIYRLPRDKNWVIGRSKCIHCNSTLPLTALIPVISFLYQKGQCQVCHRRIPIRYLCVEVMAILASIYALLPHPISIESLLLWLYLLITIALFWIDWETYLLPNPLTYLLIGIGLLYHYTTNTVLESIIATLVGSGIFLVLGYITKWIYKKETIGGGDIKLAAGIGAYWGISHVLCTIYMSFLAGGIIALIAIIFRKKNRHDYLPFGPILIASSWACFQLKERVISWLLY